MMVLTKRLKVLSVLAAAIGIYIMMSGPDASTTSLAPAGTAANRTADAPAAGAAHGAARPSSADSGGLLARLAHRVASSKTVESLWPRRRRPWSWPRPRRLPRRPCPSP